MTIQQALQRSTDTIHEKFSTHVKSEPEDQWRAPFERLLVSVGEVIDTPVVATGEVRLDIAQANRISAFQLARCHATLPNGKLQARALHSRL